MGAKQEPISSGAIPSRAGRLFQHHSEIINERIVGAKTGRWYAFYHRCLGCAFGRFKSERDAKRWSMTYGYLFEGPISMPGDNG